MIIAALALLETDEQRNELAEFYKKNKYRLYMIAYSNLHNKERSEDAVQETFLRIAKNQERFFGLSEGGRVAYAEVIARNVSVYMYKKASKPVMVELSENASYSDSENPPEEEMMYKFTKNKLIEFVAKLPSGQRDVLYLKVVQDMPIKEIAEKLSLTENAVRQRLFAARKAIKEAIHKGEI